MVSPLALLGAVYPRGDLCVGRAVLEVTQPGLVGQTL